MLPTTRDPDKAVPFAPPPWELDHPDRLRIDQDLAADHRVRLVDFLVDLLDLTALYASYRGCGSPPHRPDLLLKVALYETSLGHHSPALWCQQARENQPVRWLACGLRPARSRCYHFRDRLAPVLEDLNRQVLQLALELDLTAGARAAQDGSTFAASATRYRLPNQETLRQRQQLLDQACGADQAQQPLPDRPYWMAETVSGRLQQRQRFVRAQEILEQRHKDNQAKRACDRQKPEAIRLAPSDPEAVPGLDKEKVYRPLFNVQFVVDLDAPLILGYGVFSQVSDVGTLQPLLQRVTRLLGRPPQILVTDSTYATGPQLAAAEAAGVTVYAPWQEKDPRAGPTAAPPWLPKDQFRWEESGRFYTCPRGQRLELEQVRTQQRSEGERVELEVYRCAGEQCRKCPLAVWCTANPEKGRTVSRSEHEEAFERLRQRMATAEGQELYRLRKETVELGFADVKRHRKLRQFGSRGRQRAEVHIALCVLVHNGLVVSRALRADVKGKDQ